MNLENLGVQELNTKDVKNIDGGAWYNDLVDGFRAGTGDTMVKHYDGYGWYWVGYGWGVSVAEQAG